MRDRIWYGDDDKVLYNFGSAHQPNLDGFKKFRGHIQEYFARPGKAIRKLSVQELRFMTQEFTTTGDFPAKVKDVLEAFSEMPPMDEAWRLAFDVRDFTNTKKDGFKIRTNSGGLTFSKIIEGQKAKIYKVTGADVSVSFDLYGGGLGFSKVWFDDEEWWQIEDTAKEIRSKWYRDEAQIAYDLISASRADSDVAWGGASGDATAVRDAATINAACTEIIKAVENLGFGVDANTPFVIIAPIDLRDRIQNAQRITLSHMGGTTGQLGQVNYNLTAAYTTKLKNQALSAALTASFFVILPGQKNKWGNRMDLTILNDSDILSYSESVVGWGRFGGAIGETEQLRRCATA